MHLTAEGQKIVENEVRIVKLEGRVDRLDSVVFHGEGGVPSLIAAIAKNSAETAQTNKNLDRLMTQMDTGLEFLKAGKTFMIIVVFVILGLLASNTFFGPWIRRELGIPDSKVTYPLPSEHSERQNSIVPNLSTPPVRR